MTHLIDTHVLIWWLTEPSRLSPGCLDSLGSGDVTVLVSAVSAYEIEFKRHIDPLLQRLPTDLATAVFSEGFDWLPIAPEDAIIAGQLPRHHRDPWDRLLIAQGIRSRCPIITRDSAFQAYDVELLW